MQHYVYVLKSVTNGQFYIGQTQDVHKRLKFHNTRRSIYTKNLAPWTLFATKAFENRCEAMKWEKKLKNLKSRLKILDFIHKNSFKIY